MTNNKNDSPMSMGQKLKMFREINNYSQDDLAQKLNVSTKTISAWETATRDINLNNAKIICEIFNIPETYFVFNKDFEKINYEMKNNISEYIKNYEFKNKVEKMLEICRQKLKDDEVPLKKEYMPVFDFGTERYLTYGLYNENSLPIKVENNFCPKESYSSNYHRIKVDDSNLENIESYKYNSEELAKYGLFDILEKCNGNIVELSDLINCNNLEVFKTTLSKTKAREYYTGGGYYEAQKDISKEHLQSQLNKTLENLNSALPKFWEIIVFLIENGAYFTKQEGIGNDVVTWKIEKDISKTNIVYRLAKDVISK